MSKDKKEKIQRREAYMKEARDSFGIEAGEDSTKYGEFVCSYFAWISPQDQKQKAEKLQNITKETN